MVEQVSSGTAASEGCMQATVFFIGSESNTLYSKLDSMMKQSPDTLGRTLPHVLGALRAGIEF